MHKVEMTTITSIIASMIINLIGKLNHTALRFFFTQFSLYSQLNISEKKLFVFMLDFRHVIA